MNANASAGAILARVRDLCFGFPAVDEKLSHGMNAFFVRGKMFLSFVHDHHGDGNLGVWVKSTHEDQKAKVAEDPGQFYVPPYVGVKGWLGVRLNVPSTDWIGLQLIVEEAWVSTAPSSVKRGGVAPVPASKRGAPPVRGTTDPEVVAEARAKLTKIAAALPEVTVEDGHFPTFRVKKKPFAYLLDNHHGDGIVAVAVKTPKAGKGSQASLLKSDPKRFFSPQYMGHNGWVGVRVDAKRTHWTELAALVEASYRLAAPAPAAGTKRKRQGASSAAPGRGSRSLRRAGARRG
ncbi:MAG TPA: MmcQ/YjbR family DNA-binding protein [Polyangiaceae bacterium]|nr:MmcQ/YjbR family DNA-binding protein [Polyangiaceae bacterium]